MMQVTSSRAQLQSDTSPVNYINTLEDWFLLGIGIWGALGNKYIYIVQYGNIFYLLSFDKDEYAREYIHMKFEDKFDDETFKVYTLTENGIESASNISEEISSDL